MKRCLISGNYLTSASPAVIGPKAALHSRKDVLETTQMERVDVGMSNWPSDIQYNVQNKVIEPGTVLISRLLVRAIREGIGTHMYGARLPDAGIWRIT